MTYPLAQAQAVAEELLSLLSPHCHRIAVVGSVRRQKPHVSDVELLFVPILQQAPDPEDLFSTLTTQSKTDLAIQELIARKILSPRLSALGRPTLGPLNKLTTHVASGIPVDLFATPSPDCWFSLLVCRTGPASLNARIATAALNRGYRWSPYSPGFHSLTSSQVHPVSSEQDLFSFVHLPFLPPEQRT